MTPRRSPCFAAPVAPTSSSLAHRSRPTSSCRSRGASAVRLLGTAALNRRVAVADAAEWTGFELPPLPYAYDALQPHISEQIMKAHHDAHFAGYVKKMNVALKLFDARLVRDDAALIKLMPDLDTVSDASLRTQIRNNGGGYLNHKQFFETMTPGGSSLSKSSALAKHIDVQFGSFGKFEKEFIDTAIGLFGSGFVWLVLDGDRLRITKYANQDNPAMDGDVLPVLGCDCWEHAWYYQYGPKKAEYIPQWWNVVHWSRVSDIYDRKL
ncbi:unnamed protein product [Agarophyton chilense]